MLRCYAGCNDSVKRSRPRFVTWGATKLRAKPGKIGDMEKRQLKKTYIREWREKRGLSLRKLAARIESEPGTELISYASLSRIETGDQPYTQETLEAIAAALNVTPGMLLERNPEMDGHVIDLLAHMDATTRDQAVAILETLARKSA